jgi:AraC-like DNA-binding protein
MLDGGQSQAFALGVEGAGIALGFEAASTRSDFVVLTDAALRYVHVDGAAAQWCGAPRQYLLGAAARDFFAPVTFERHEALDRRVMRNGNAILSQLDLSVRLDGTSQWANVSRRRTGDAHATYVATTGRLIGPVVRPSLVCLAEAMREPFDDETLLQALAARAGVSVLQLEEDAQDEFDLSLSRLVTKLRLERVIELVGAGSSLADAAKACGYATQSALSRRFAAVSGMSPTEFHRLVRAGGKTPQPAVAPNLAQPAQRPAYRSR